MSLESPAPPLRRERRPRQWWRAANIISQLGRCRTSHLNIKRCKHTRALLLAWERRGRLQVGSTTQSSAPLCTAAHAPRASQSAMASRGAVMMTRLASKPGAACLQRQLRSLCEQKLVRCLGSVTPARPHCMPAATGVETEITRFTSQAAQEGGQLLRQQRLHLRLLCNRQAGPGWRGQRLRHDTDILRQ